MKFQLRRSVAFIPVLSGQDKSCLWLALAMANGPADGNPRYSYCYLLLPGPIHQGAQKASTGLNTFGTIDQEERNVEALRFHRMLCPYCACTVVTEAQFIQSISSKIQLQA